MTGAAAEAAAGRTDSGEAKPQAGAGGTAHGETKAHGGAGAQAGEAADGEKKKKRRRRRRKKKGPAADAQGADANGQSTPPAAEGKGRKDSQLPFQRFFDHTRRHAFSVGEIVAGRVSLVSEDIVSVDLFGKAHAFARRHEPRDIPVEVRAKEPPAPEVAEVDKKVQDTVEPRTATAASADDCQTSLPGAEGTAVAAEAGASPAGDGAPVPPEAAPEAAAPGAGAPDPAAPEATAAAADAAPEAPAAAGTAAPEAAAPETAAPETAAPEATAPETAAPEATAPEAAAPETAAPEATAAPALAAAAGTAAPEAAKPEGTAAPEASAETAAPEAAAPDAATAAAAAPEASAEAAAPDAATPEAAAPDAATPEAAAPEAAAPEAAATNEPAPADGANAAETGANAPAGNAPAAPSAAPASGGAPEASPEASPEPVPEPDYKLRPEGVAPLDDGTILRGRVGAVAESGHIAIVNQLFDAEAVRAYLDQCRRSRERVEGLVFGFNRGGFDILLYGQRAFCPVSGMSIDLIEDPRTQLGQWAQFHVQTAKSGTQGLVVSRRSILEKEARKRAKALLKSLEAGQKLPGRVTQIRDYGLFVDIGGVEGLVHQSEVSWDRGVRPSDVAKVGDSVEVQVLKVHEPQSKKERHDRVSLSIKALQPDPWTAHTDLLQEGTPVKGTIARTAEFGAFVTVAPGIDGLLHVSELGKDLKHANQAVKEGQEIHVVIERVDMKQRRVSLSRLSDEEIELFEKGELVDPERRPRRVKQGSHITVKVAQVIPAGLIVAIEGMVGKRGRGFIPNSEMGTPRGTDHRRKWPPGTEIDVKVIGTDRDGGLRCSRKGFLADEERRAVREYRKEAASQGFGTFGDLLRSKLGLDENTQ
ncbi:MAG: S1 RNA-binding domain-containing protein [Sandaracinaceae bacterium]